ncbi:MAG: hypothetical protein AAF512_04955 [Pseudomonadota bacterium]
MNKRKILTIALAGIALLTLFLAAIPFTQSMWPTERAEAALPQVKVSNINPGEYSVLPYTARNVGFHDWTLKVFVYRKLDGTYNVWRVPTKYDSVGMPDLHWWRPMLECKNFGPTEVDGAVDETMPIKCHDEEYSDFWGTEWQWTIDGKNLGEMVEDMDFIPGSVEGEFYVFQGSS